MSNTSRPLMGTTVASNPAIVVATSPNAVFNVPDDTGVDASTSQVNDPRAPVHDWEKRYKDLQSFHTKTLSTKDQEILALRDTNSPGTFVVPKTADELAAFKAKNPETYQFIQTIAHDMAAKQVEPIVGRLKDAEFELGKEKDSQALVQLNARHPDFQAVDASPEFHTWLGSQPDHIQGWIFNNPDDAGKISSVLDLFKASTGWGVNAGNTSATQANQPSGADAVNVGSTATGETVSGDPRANNPQYRWSESEIGNMRPEEYAKFSSAIDLALSEGRVQMGR